MQVRPRTSRAPGWLNVRTVLGLFLFAISVGTGWIVVEASDAGSAVWAAARDLPEGQRLEDDDLEAVKVNLPNDQLAKYLASTTPVDGTTLLRSIRRGELVSAASVSGSGSSPARSITIPIAAEHAVGGSLSPGDRVDVFATLGAGRGGARTILLVHDVEVEALLRSDGLVMEDGRIAGVTLRVAAGDAARVAFAVRNADIDLVRVEGPPGPALPVSLKAADL